MFSSTGRFQFTVFKQVTFLVNFIPREELLQCKKNETKPACNFLFALIHRGYLNYSLLLLQKKLQKFIEQIAVTTRNVICHEESFILSRNHACFTVSLSFNSLLSPTIPSGNGGLIIFLSSLPTGCRLGR